GITRTSCVGSHFTYHNYKGLPVIHVKLERLIRIGAATGIANPVGADVNWIKAAQIRSNEDEVGACAPRIGVHRHTLSRPCGIGERVRIVMVLLSVTKDLTRRAGRTGLRNPAAEEPIILRRIARIDAPIDYATTRRGRRRSRRGRRRRATASPASVIPE